MMKIDFCPLAVYFDVGSRVSASKSPKPFIYFFKIFVVNYGDQAGKLSVMMIAFPDWNLLH